MNTDMTDFRPLPSNFIVYDHTNPSPYFTPEKIAYIESINAEFSEDEVKLIRSMERFAFNLNMNGVGGDQIPGIRKSPSEMHLYFRRFSSDEPWRAVAERLMDSIPNDFEDKGRCLMDLCRATLPNGDRYYPMTLMGDHTEWDRHLHEVAVDFGTKLGRFDKGKFVVSDGQKFGFSELKWDRLLHRQRIPKKW